MTDFFEIISYTFVQRAIIGGGLLALITGLMGVLVNMKRASFFGDAIAHSSLAGVALGLFLHLNPLLFAFIYAGMMAVGLPWIKQKTKFDLDNILGIFLPVSMGFGVILFSLLPGFQPDLMGYLFGNILAITWWDVILLVVLSFVIQLVFLFFSSKLILINIDRDYAQLLGIKVKYYDLLYNLLLAVTIIAGVKLVGIILVNALLVISPSIAKLLAKNLNQMLVLSPLVGIVCVLVGITLSVVLNTPPGAVIAVVGGVFFMLVVLVQRILRS